MNAVTNLVANYSCKPIWTLPVNKYLSGDQVQIRIERAVIPLLLEKESIRPRRLRRSNVARWFVGKFGPAMPRTDPHDETAIREIGLKPMAATPGREFRTRSPAASSSSARHSIGKPERRHPERDLSRWKLGRHLWCFPTFRFIEDLPSPPGVTQSGKLLNERIALPPTEHFDDILTLGFPSFTHDKYMLYCFFSMFLMRVPN